MTLMETVAVLAALAGVASRAQLVHGQGQRLVGFLADGAERHGSRDEMADDVFHRFHPVDVNRVTLEAEEVAQEDGAVLLVRQAGEFLELLVAARAGGQLERGDGFRVPGMALAVLAVGEQPDVREQAVRLFRAEACRVECGIVPCDFFQADAADGGCGSAEISLEQLLAQSHGLENLGPAVGADGADAHLAHDFVEALADGLDVVLFRRLVVHLDFPPLHQVVQHGERHVRIDGAGPEAQQHGGVHHLADFAALHHQGGLHPLLDGNQMVVHRTDSQ